MTTTITADDFDQVPTPVADVARGIVAGSATWLDLLRANWHQDLTEDHFVATRLWIDRQYGRQMKGTYYGRWPFVQHVLEELLHAEANQTQPPARVMREGNGLIQAEIGPVWVWDPRRGPEYTVASLLGEQSI